MNDHMIPIFNNIKKLYIDNHDISKTENILNALSCEQLIHIGKKFIENIDIEYDLLSKKERQPYHYGRSKALVNEIINVFDKNTCFTDTKFNNEENRIFRDDFETYQTLDKAVNINFQEKIKNKSFDRSFVNAVHVNFSNIKKKEKKINFSEMYSKTNKIYKRMKKMSESKSIKDKEEITEIAQEIYEKWQNFIIPKNVMNQIISDYKQTELKNDVKIDKKRSEFIINVASVKEGQFKIRRDITNGEYMIYDFGKECYNLFDDEYKSENEDGLYECVKELYYNMSDLKKIIKNKDFSSIEEITMDENWIYNI